MFEDLTKMDWFILGVALALGYGMVRFLLVSMQDRSTGIPQPEGHSANLPAWHEVLGVQPDATFEEIKAAYAHKLAQYQIEAVSDLGPEFITLAGKKKDETQRAYEQAVRQLTGL